MLSSPLRRCSITDQYLPSDFLVRFSYLRLPPSVGSGQSLAIVPDGIQHSKYTSRKGGHSVYTQCLREAVDQLYRKAPFKRATKDSTVVANAKLGDQVLHLLRLRVLQELERLAVHMQYTIIRDDVEDSGPIIRRLTADEFSAIENSGTIPYQNALAIVVVPPLEKDPVTGEFPRASMSPMPFSEGTDSSPPLGITLPPLSVLLPASADARSCSEGPHVRGLLPKLAVPLYNALPAFPFAPQRAALQDLLARATVVEQKRDRRQQNPKPNGVISTESNLSHAYLLSSHQGTVKSGDAAAVAIALWRLRMFEGGTVPDGSLTWSAGTDQDTEKLL